MVAIGGVVRTARLVLRPVTPADRDAVVAIHTDPETATYRPGGAATVREALGLLDGWIAHWAENGFGYWAIVAAATGETVGFGGVQHREFDGDTYLNVYYRFSPQAWGKGYAVEMVNAAVDWAERSLPDLPVQVVTTVDNEPAMRVAERAGFVEVRQAEYEGALSRFYRRPNPGSVPPKGIR